VTWTDPLPRPSVAHPEDCECFERCRVHPDAWQVYPEFETDWRTPSDVAGNL
jgi:hypothetical protein